MEFSNSRTEKKKGKIWLDWFFQSLLLPIFYSSLICICKFTNFIITSLTFTHNLTNNFHKAYMRNSGYVRCLDLFLYVFVLLCTQLHVYLIARDYIWFTHRKPNKHTHWRYLLLDIKLIKSYFFLHWSSFEYEYLITSI